MRTPRVGSTPSPVDLHVKMGVDAVGISPDDDWLVTGGLDQICLWDPAGSGVLPERALRLWRIRPSPLTSY